MIHDDNDPEDQPPLRDPVTRLLVIVVVALFACSIGGLILSLLGVLSDGR